MNCYPYCVIGRAKQGWTALLTLLILVFAWTWAMGTAQAAEISELREIEIGDELAVSMLKGAKLLNHDPAQEYLNQVGRWLSVGTERVDLPWQFGIMDRAEIGAYPLPGGKVLITVGLLKKLNDEAELAGMLAHEIAHVVQRHQLKTLSTEPGADKLGAVTYALETANEFAADRMAVVIMARAGYDPNAYLNAMRTLQNDRSNDPGLGMLAAVHPPFKDRLAELQRVVQGMAKTPPPAVPDKGRARFAALLNMLKASGRK